MRYQVQVDGGLWQNMGDHAADEFGIARVDVSGLPTPENAYAFRVRAVDNHGNIGKQSETMLGSTLAGYGNVALATRGSTISSSSYNSGSGGDAYKDIHANNGKRYTTVVNSPDPDKGCWQSGVDPAVTPQWLEIDFGQDRTIDLINVFTLQDALNYTDDPLDTDTFTTYGITGFTMQYWDGAAWQDIDSVTGNNLVWVQFTFAEITTDKIRLYTTATALALGGCPVVELEAWGS